MFIWFFLLINESALELSYVCTILKIWSAFLFHNYYCPKYRITTFVVTVEYTHWHTCTLIFIQNKYINYCYHFQMAVIIITLTVMLLQTADVHRDTGVGSGNATLHWDRFCCTSVTSSPRSGVAAGVANSPGIPRRDGLAGSLLYSFGGSPAHAPSWCHSS